METLVRVRWSTSPSTHRSTPVAAWTPEGRKGAGQHRQAVLPGSRRFQAFDLPLGGFDSAGSIPATSAMPWPFSRKPGHSNPRHPGLRAHRVPGTADV